ncbi:hypothetical protein DSO57_1004360 [Entomophthora muscae]|uniref:Uncharacterized protein n=1 Tax=Entomophthora muscae TaxID=34485 RepID=A0ACC2T826_9FUNG|nr:hypothetical protein DSO57_1004360 [Entomophthora muscae]
MRDNTGGGKKLKAKGGAASAQSAAPAYTGNVPKDWEAQVTAGDISGQAGSRKVQQKDSDVPNKGAAEAGLSLGEELDNPDWLYKVSDKEVDTLHHNLTPKQRNEILSHQQLFRELLSEYPIDNITAQG